MKIGIIGPGNVGGALAKGLLRSGHDVVMGVRNKSSNKLEKLLKEIPSLKVENIKESIEISEVIIIAVPPTAVEQIAEIIKDFPGKIIIDTTNSMSNKPENFENGYLALKEIIKSDDIVKCFNSTGFDNMADPKYGNTSADMFVAGGSKKAKEIAQKLSNDIGFENCYDFGDDTKVKLLEQVAAVWVNLAVFQNEGRNIAFKVLKK